MIPRTFVLNQTDIDQAEEFSKQFANHQAQILTAALTAILVAGSRVDATTPATNAEAGRKTMAPTEFFAKLKPATDTEKVLAAAFFLEFSQAVTEFTSEHIRSALRQARVVLPENINMAMISNAKRGFMSDLGKKLDGRKSWSLTQMGLEYVNSLQESRGHEV
jgi:hypothetical protein